MDTETIQQLKDIMPLEALPFWEGRGFLMLTILLTVVFLVGMGGVIGRILQKKRKRSVLREGAGTEKPPLQPSPRAKALEAMLSLKKSLASMDLSDVIQLKSLSQSITTILRTYLEEAHGWKAPQATTEEIRCWLVGVASGSAKSQSLVDPKGLEASLQYLEWVVFSKNPTVSQLPFEELTENLLVWLRKQSEGGSHAPPMG